MKAGTTNARITLASTSTATHSPTPIIFSAGKSALTNAPNTTTMDHQQRVIDADREPDHGDDIAQQIRDRHRLSQQIREPQRHARGRETHQKRQRGGDQGAEDENQNAEGERQRALLRMIAAGALEVLMS